MARIPTGDFGYSSRGVVNAPDTTAIGASIEQLGNTAARVSDIQVEQDKQMNRAAALNGALDHQIAVKTIVENQHDRLASGELKPEDAATDYQDQVAKLEPPTVVGLDPLGQDNLTRALRRNVFLGQQQSLHAADAQKKIQFQDSFSTALDQNGKLAAMPSADVQALNDSLAAYRQLGLNAGVPANVVDKAIQDRRDRNWYNQAMQMAIEGKDSLSDIKQLEHDLTAADGFYNNKLDADKRDALLRSVVNSRIAIENRLERQSDRAEARAGHVMSQVDRQINSGYMAGPEQWAEWETQIKGTSYEPDFKDAQRAEGDVQQLLRAPIAAQLKAVQDADIRLQSEGGSLTEVANANRLKHAVINNLNTLERSPLVFNANRTGQQVAPLDLSQLAVPGGSPEIQQQISDRVVTLQAMRRQYGPQVPIVPLLPQEASALATALNNADGRQSATILGALRNASGNDDAYRAAVQQIAPDSPVKALAGMLASRERDITLQRNWFSDNVRATGGDVAQTILDGVDILSPPKGQKAEDGKPKLALFLPDEKELVTAFAGATGDAFRGRPQAEEIAYQTVKAYYVGAAAKAGKVATGPGDVDQTFVNQAVTATLGAVVNYNGNGSVLAPWGMESGTFEDSANRAIAQAVTDKRLPAGTERQIGSLGLVNDGEGTYRVTNGRNFVTDTQGRPFVIHIAPPQGGTGPQ